MRLASLACNHIRREAAPSAESHLAILYASVRRGNSVGGRDMGAPSRLRRSNSGSSTAVGNPTLLPRVAAADRLAIDAELKQSLMELLTGRHALVRRVHHLYIPASVIPIYFPGRDVYQFSSSLHIHCVCL